MPRRLLPTVLALGLGLAALAWGLVSLQRIFVRERDDARGSIAARREALEEFARAALSERLRRALEDATPRFERALRDPLEPAQDLLLVTDGEQRLPRTWTPGGEDGAARAVHASVLAATTPTEDDEDWAERLRLGRDTLEAITSGERDAIERTTRRLLEHRARYALAAAKDVPHLLAILEVFVEKGRPDRALMSALLRDGLAVSGSESVEGLERTLLRRRDRFGHADFVFLAERLQRLAELANVPAEDFAARVAESSTHVPLPTVEGPSLAGGWYVEPGVRGVRGIRVDPRAQVAAIQDEMRDRRLLGPGDSLAFATGAAASLAVAPLRVESPAWRGAEADVVARYRLKSALVLACGLFALAIVALAFVAQERRQRFVQLKADFVATVSHELRTPLASVRVLAETLERRVADHPAARDYPARIVGEIDRLGHLVENVLSFSRLEKGRWKPRVSDVALVDLVPVVEDEGAQATRARVELETHGLEGESVRADPDLLRLLVANLARNACVHNGRDPVRLRLEARRGRGLTLLFSDNGAGIAEGERERVFEEFVRGRGAGSRGSGLGLALCRRIMEAHGGRIDVLASSPEGTTFRLEFPRGDA